MLWLPNRGVSHKLKLKKAAQLGGFFVFETRQLDETRWGQTSLYTTRGQTSSKLGGVKLRSDLYPIHNATRGQTSSAGVALKGYKHMNT